LNYLLQFSLRSLCTATLAGLRTVTHARHGRAGQIEAGNLLGHDTLGAEPASVGDDGRTILGDVFIEQDASLDTA
jgi:hypothetical protein